MLRSQVSDRLMLQGLSSTLDTKLLKTALPSHRDTPAQRQTTTGGCLQLIAEEVSSRQQQTCISVHR